MDNKDQHIRISWLVLYKRSIKNHDQYHYYTKDILECIEKELFSTHEVFNNHTETLVELLALYAAKEYTFTYLEDTMFVIEQLFVNYQSINIIKCMKDAIKINAYKIDFKVIPLLIQIVSNFMEKDEKKKLALEWLLYSYKISPEYVRDDTIEMVNQILDQKKHDLAVVCLEMLQILPVGIYNMHVIDKIFEINYKDDKEIDLLIDTYKFIFEKTGFEATDKQAEYMLNIVSGRMKNDIDYRNMN